MLFSAAARRQPFARFLGRREQLFRVAVGDDQLAFGVGQQDRVGDRVDDAVQQHPLLAEARLGEQLAAQQARDLLPERAAEPGGLGSIWGPRCSLTRSSPWPELGFRTGAG